MRSFLLEMLDRAGRRAIMRTSKAMMYSFTVYIEGALSSLKKKGIVCAHEKCHRIAAFKLGRNDDAVCGLCLHACPEWGDRGEYQCGGSTMMEPSFPLTCCSHICDGNGKGILYIYMCL
jgi:hypothetical protein